VTKKREILSLIHAMEELDFQKSTIVTMEKEGVLEEGKKRLEISVKIVQNAGHPINK
jgi:hypothetical protein